MLIETKFINYKCLYMTSFSLTYRRLAWSMDDKPSEILNKKTRTQFGLPAPNNLCPPSNPIEG